MSVDLLCSRNARPEMGRERPGALLARRTRTMKLCSFDARSKGQPRPLPSMQSGESLKALAWDNGTSRRASGWEGEKAARSGRSNRPPSEERNERAWKEHHSSCSTRAVEAPRARPFGRGCERAWERSGVAWSSSCSRNAHTQKVLVRRAHLRIGQATLRREKRASLEGKEKGGLMIFCARATRSGSSVWLAGRSVGLSGLSGCSE